jgi:hypothetical protein
MMVHAVVIMLPSYSSEWLDALKEKTYQQGKSFNPGAERQRDRRVSLAARQSSRPAPHQMRWARKTRISRGAYTGLPVTHASTWAQIAALSGQCCIAAMCCGYGG